MSALIDRIVSRRRHEQETEALALWRSPAVEDRSDFLWSELIKEVRELVDEYNRELPSPSPATFSESSARQRFEVGWGGAPVGTLAVYRKGPHRIEFFSECAGTVGSDGIEIKADNERNVIFSINGKIKPTPKDVAEYLLEKIFR